MEINLLYFGVLKDLSGTSSERLVVKPDSTVRDVLVLLMQRRGLASALSGTAVAVNQVYASADAQLREGDEVALLPPVSGGLA